MSNLSDTATLADIADMLEISYYKLWVRRNKCVWFPEPVATIVDVPLYRVSAVLMAIGRNLDGDRLTG